MEYQPMKYIYRPTSNPHANTILLLHGTGGNEEDLLPLLKQFGQGFNILSLRGNVLESGMPRFFKRLGMGVFDEEDLAFRTREMIANIKAIAENEKFDDSRIIALGYSNGANIAGSTLMMYPDFLKGAILFRPMQPFRQPEGFENTTRVPVFISSGKFDPTVNPAEIENYINLLNNAGFHVAHHQLSTSHNLTQEDLDLAVNWYQNNFS